MKQDLRRFGNQKLLFSLLTKRSPVGNGELSNHRMVIKMYVCEGVGVGGVST